MTHFSLRHGSFHRILDSDDHAPPPRDELDTLLRDWHRENADLARASREATLHAVRVDARLGSDSTEPADERPVIRRLGRALTGRLARVAACIGLVGVIATAMFLPTRNDALASEILVADGGQLTALVTNEDGTTEQLGPCPLQHTDVDAEITGPFTRVTLKQRYANPYPQKIEAVYTFPMSHRSAVDTMRIRVKGPSGERVIEGEVKERTQARQIYESAKASGYVASLLEQERPNIFTQHVANIEPGATIVVEISYLETLERKDGVYSFAFPMTVGPRYIPGTPSTGGPNLPGGLVPRAGLVLLGPAQVEVTTPNASMTSSAAQQLIASSQPIRMPTPDWLERAATANGPATQFVATYANGSKETGAIYAGGAGEVNGRWFWFGAQGSGGTGFAADTDQVPDAARITPMPVRPPERAGHDISVRVAIDTGGAPLTGVSSELHDIETTKDDGGERTVITLKDKNAIPNRDFVLSWKTDANLIAPGVFAHMRSSNDLTRGGYVAVVLDPPARLDEKDAPPRELIFVLDTSGSMNGFPIEKAKDVMTKAIATMRPRDTFNVITFAGSTNVLWQASRPASDENKFEATQFVNNRQGGGGTEMMAAINAALKPLDRGGWIKLSELADLPADGRTVKVLAPLDSYDTNASTLALGDGKSLRVTMSTSIPTVRERDGKMLALDGKWITKDGDRVLAVDRASFERSSISPTRIVMFLTDGMVGNDGAIVQAVRDNARTTRVFSFGIGQSVNRSLLDGIAIEGRGASEIVTLEANADAAVERFVKRIENPVLVDIEATFAGVEVLDLIPKPSLIPDLFDESPLVLLGRYEKPGTGTVTIRGMNGNGEWERSMPIALPAHGSEHAAVPTLWARAKVEEIIAPNRAAIESQQVDAATHGAIVALGEAYRILTPFTSFVAVERGRVTVGGSPMLVQVPIELPEGTSWKGFFGEGVAPAAWFAMQPVGGGPEARMRAATTKLDALGRMYAGQPASPVFAPASDESTQLHYAQPQQRYFRVLAARVDEDLRDKLVKENVETAERYKAEGRYSEALGLVNEALVVEVENAKAKELRDSLASVQTLQLDGLQEGTTGVAAVGSERGADTLMGAAGVTSSWTQVGVVQKSDGLTGIDFSNAPQFNLNGSINAFYLDPCGTDVNRGNAFGGGFAVAGMNYQQPDSAGFSGGGGGFGGGSIPGKRVGGGVISPPGAPQTPATPPATRTAVPFLGEIPVADVVFTGAASESGVIPSPANGRTIEARLMPPKAGESASSGPGGDPSNNLADKKPAADAAKGSKDARDASASRERAEAEKKPAEPAAPSSAPPSSTPASEVAREAPAASAETRVTNSSQAFPSGEPAQDEVDQLSKRTDPATAGLADRAPADPKEKPESQLERPKERTVTASSLTDAERDLLARRLERTLLALALAAQADATSALTLATTAEPKLFIDSDGRVRVTILTAKDDTAADSLADALRKAGFEVEGVDPRTRIVVARIKLADLIAIALRPDLRRIEPFRASAG